MNPDEDPGHLRSDAIAPHLVLIGGSSHICSKGVCVWRTATRVDALRGNYSRADVPSGIYPKRGSGKRFRFLPYDAPQGLEHSIGIPSSLCRAGPNARHIPEWTWAAALGISGTAIIPVHGEHRSRRTVEERHAPCARP